MKYNLKMKGTYIGAVKVEDVIAGKGYVLVSQERYVDVEVDAESVEAGVKKVYDNADNASKITVREPVDGTMKIAKGAKKYATPELIAIVEKNLDHMEVPKDMQLNKHSLEVDVLNAVMD